MFSLFWRQFLHHCGTDKCNCRIGKSNQPEALLLGIEGTFNAGKIADSMTPITEATSTSGHQGGLGRRMPLRARRAVEVIWRCRRHFLIGKLTRLLTRCVPPQCSKYGNLSDAYNTKPETSNSRLKCVIVFFLPVAASSSHTRLCFLATECLLKPATLFFQGHCIPLPHSGNERKLKKTCTPPSSPIMSSQEKTETFSPASLEGARDTPSANSQPQSEGSDHATSCPEPAESPRQVQGFMVSSKCFSVLEVSGC